MLFKHLRLDSHESSQDFSRNVFLRFSGAVKKRTTPRNVALTPIQLRSGLTMRRLSYLGVYHCGLPYISLHLGEN